MASFDVVSLQLESVCVLPHPGPLPKERGSFRNLLESRCVPSSVVAISSFGRRLVEGQKTVCILSLRFWLKYGGIKAGRERPIVWSRHKTMLARWIILLLLVMPGWGNSWAAPRSESSTKTGAAMFQDKIRPLLSQYCLGCHGEKKKRGLDLRVYADDAAAKKDQEVFEKVLDKLETHEMPPEEKPQPSASERDLMVNWIGSEVLGCDCKHPDPGRVTIRRLNRTEYNHTIHDLLGVDFHAADDFPLDNVGYGFDNIGDVLSLSPMLMEKYMAAADKAIAMVFAPV